MKITVRIPHEAYAYTEVEFDSLKEYEEQYPLVAESIVKTKQGARTKAKKYRENPFNDVTFTESEESKLPF